MGQHSGPPGWQHCDRAEAIRQAEIFHAEMTKWRELFEQVREQRDDYKEERDTLIAQRDASRRAWRAWALEMADRWEVK